MTDNLSKKEYLRRDKILNGNLWKTVIILTIPLAIYSLFNFLYGFIDMLLVADLGSSYVNSVVFIDELKSAVSAFGGAIAAAGCVLIARQYAIGNLKTARQYAGNSIILGVLVSSGVIILMMLFGAPILAFFGATEDMIENGLSYYQVQMLTTLLIAINSVFIGIEKAKGNTRLVLWLNLIVMTVKLILSVLWIKVFGGDLFHLALASLIAQGILSGVAVVILFHPKNSLHISIKELNPNTVMMKEIFILAIPVFIGKFLFNMGKVVINGVALLYHPFAVGALGIAYKVHNGFSQVANTFEESEMSIIAQNIGNKNINRAIKAYVISLIYATSVATIGLIVAYFWQDWMITLFLRDGIDFAEKFELTKLIYAFEQFSSVTGAVIATTTGMFIAFKKTKIVFWINILRVIILRLPVIYFLYYVIDPTATWHVGFVMLFSNTLTMIISIIFALIHIHNLKTYGDARLQLIHAEEYIKES